MTVVVGTAGHIDHGKTALLHALTGMDADRLPEERRRGMTIDVGYAWLALPDGTEIDFVDVPGHDRLVGNMLVGAGEIDAAMLVVAADDGPRAQTIEHLELLDALRIATGIAVITKIDVLGGDADRLAACDRDLRVILSHTSLADSPVFQVSSTTGAGIAELATGLVTLRNRVVAAAPSRLRSVRVAVDRSFSVRGRGLVVTGTLRGGPVHRGMNLRLEPEGGLIRVREVQVHGSAVEEVAGGGRVAFNLAAPGDNRPRRGSVLTDDPSVVATDRLLVAIRPTSSPPDRGRGDPRLRSGRELAVHIGTDRVEAVVRRSPRDSIVTAEGEETLLLRLARRIAAGPGDRFVLRRPSPDATVGGGRILDPLPPRGQSRRHATGESLHALAGAATPAAFARALVALHGAVPAARIHQDAAGELEADAASPPGVPLAGWWLAPAIATALGEQARSIVLAAHEADPEALGVPLAEIRSLLAARIRQRVTIGRDDAGAVAGALVDGLVHDGTLARDAERVHDPARGAGLPPRTIAAMDHLESLLSVAAPPSLAEAVRLSGCPPDGIRTLESTGRLVRVETDLAWSGVTYDRLASLAIRLAGEGPLTPAAYRDATGTSRKYALAVLEDLGRRGLLRRTESGHVPGPRSPRAGSAPNGTATGP